jgi:Variant SH3 domain
MADALRRCRIIKDYQASNPDPFSVQPDELFQVSEKVDLWSDNPNWIWIWCTDQRGKSGWVPQNIMQRGEEKNTATARSAYRALELTVVIGDELEVVREESGWLWCINQQKEQGWIPLEHVTWLA